MAGLGGMAGLGLPGGNEAGLQEGAEEAKPGRARTPWGSGSCRQSGPGAAAATRAFAFPFRFATAAAQFGLYRKKFVFAVRARPSGRVS